MLPRSSYGGPGHIGTDFLSAISPVGRGGNLLGWPQRFEYNSSEIKRHGAGTASIGDVDGDGDQEVVIGSAHCHEWPLGSHHCLGLWAFEAHGAVVNGFPKLTHAPAIPRFAQPALGDLDGDGLTEIVWASATGEIVVWNTSGIALPEYLHWPMSRQNPAHTGALQLPR